MNPIITGHVTINSQLLITLQFDVQEFRLQNVCLQIHVRIVMEAYSGFDILTALVIKRTVLWDITPCSPLNQVMGVFISVYATIVG
jgi:hypothetical protein